MELRQMRLDLISVLYLIAASLFAGGCSRHDNPWEGASGLKVVVSFPPLYCFAANVAANEQHEDARVLCLLDATGVHDYHPSPRDAIKLHKADLFFLNGLDLDEGFGKQLAANADNPRLKLLEIGNSFDKKLLIEAAHEEHHHGHGHHHHGHKHGEYDPHIWLGLPEAIRMVEYIRDRLKEADDDPERDQRYHDRSLAYIKKLKDLHADGKKKLEGKRNRKLISFHDSLRYFARSLDLEVAGTIQPYAGEDAHARRIADLVELCKKHNVRVIVVEPGQLATQADTLKRDLEKEIRDIEVVEIDMLESVPRTALTPDYYEQKMKDNIDRLAKAMK